MANVSYRRVSSVDQKTDRQLEGMAFDESFEDKASAGTTNRPGLEACLKFLRKGDTLHVHSIDRLARNLMDLQRLVIDLTGRGVAVHFHKESLIFSGKKNPMNNLMLQMMGAFAEFEKALINERQREGIASARAKGTHLGRAAKLTQQEVQIILRRLFDGESVAALADEFGVSRQTVYQSIKRIDKLGESSLIVCKICGDKVTFIETHLSESHGSMTVPDYISSFPSALLMSERAMKGFKRIYEAAKSGDTEAAIELTKMKTEMGKR